jgi:phage tail-like protein
MNPLRILMSESLPPYFSLADHNRDHNGQGTLIRFLSIFEEEAKHIKQDIETLKNQDPENLPEPLLSHLAPLKGNPPTVFRNTLKYRKILKEIFDILSRRGTLEAVGLFFSLLGLNVEFNPVLVNPESKYDQDKYDFPVLFDTSVSYCRYYNLALEDPDNQVPYLGEDPLPLWAIRNLLDILNFLLPINVFITELSYNGTVIISPLIVLRKYSPLDTDLRIIAESIIRKV